VIGILVGVAISRSGFVESQERDLLNAQIQDLRRDVEQARDRQAEVEATNNAAKAFLDQAYEAVMVDRLRGRRVAVLFVGQVRRRLLAAVERTLDDAGGDRLRLRALEVPIDGRLDNIESVLQARPALAGYAGDGNLSNLGRDLAREFVAGGRTPLWDALSDQLVQEREGGPQGEADAVVVVRTSEPQRGPTARFLRGIYEGLGGSVPAVGVEFTGSAPSAVAVYRSATLSSVDNLDTPVGRVALALLLAGAREGSYGVKDSADTVLPPVEPLAPTLPSG
jgi:copper transport outer membrane protein MctB